MRIRLERLYIEYTEFCRERKIYDVLDKITPENIHLQGSTEGVFISGKASACRRAVEFALFLANKHNRGTDDDELRYGAIWGLHEYYEIIARGDRYLTRSQVEHLQAAVLVSEQCYFALRSRSVQNEEFRMWSPKPKFHMWLHLADDFIGVTFINPRFTWCYMDEDFVGRISEPNVCAFLRCSLAPRNSRWRWGPWRKQIPL